MKAERAAFDFVVVLDKFDRGHCFLNYMGAPGEFFWQLLFLSAAPGDRLYEQKRMFIIVFGPCKRFCEFANFDFFS